MYVYMYKKGDVDRINASINLSSFRSLPVSDEANAEFGILELNKQHVRLYV